MGAREHRQRGELVRHAAQGGGDAVECRQHHVATGGVEHQAVGQVVDVFAGAGEVHELERRAEFGVVGQAFLDEVLDRLDVVVGGAFDLFDAGSVGGREAIGQGAEAGGGAFVEGGQLGNAGFGGQGQQPLHFNTHAG